MDRGRRDKVCTTFGRIAPTIFDRAKSSKIWSDFWQLSTLIANISEMDRQNEIWKLHYLVRAIISYWAKISEIWLSLLTKTKKKNKTNKTGIGVKFDPPTLFSEEYISAIGRCRLFEFLHAPRPRKLNTQWDLRGRAASSCALPLFLVDSELPDG